MNPIEQRNEFKIDKEQIKNHLEEKAIDPKFNLEGKSIDQKAKQFADFFNGEIVNLE